MRRPPRPRGSIRLRLAALLTTLFVLLGGTLLGVSYALVRSSLTVDPRQLAGEVAERLGIELRPGLRDGGLRARALGIPPEQVRRVREQIRQVQEELADEEARELTLQYLVILAAMALLSGALGWFVAGRVLRPMSDITATARRVSQESLHERISLDGPDDELKQLADTFDSMLARLEDAFERQSAFVRNASHELRTPLSVIRAEADVTLADEPDDPNALRRALATVRDAGRRSERLIDALLTLARADRDDRAPARVDLAALAREVGKRGDVAGLDLRLSLSAAELIGDLELLQAMTANLLDNAVRHNVAGGWIEVGTRTVGDQVRLEISNSGAPTTADEAASLTEPFRRLGTARTGDGLGLGLSIAASVVKAHDGSLSIEPLDQGGLRVSVELPAAPRPTRFADASHAGARPG